jgi:hypothetical protein
MRDCEWVSRQIAIDEVRRRFERRAARRQRLSRLLHAGRQVRRPAPVLVDLRRG